MDYILGAVVLSLPPSRIEKRQRMDASHFVMQHVQELGLIQNFNCDLSPPPKKVRRSERSCIDE